MANFVYVASTFIIYYFALGAAALTIFSVINMWFISLYEACVGELAPESRKKASIAAAIVTILGLLRLGAVKSMLTIVELVRMGALNSMLMVEIAINTVFWMIDSGCGAALWILIVGIWWVCEFALIALFIFIVICMVLMVYEIIYESQYVFVVGVWFLLLILHWLSMATSMWLDMLLQDPLLQPNRNMYNVTA
jgi:hypothetical protein